MDELMEALIEGKKFGRYEATFISEAVMAALKSYEFKCQCGTFGVDILEEMVAKLQVDKAKLVTSANRDWRNGG